MAKDKTLSFFDQRKPDGVEHLLPIVPTNPALLPFHQLSWDRQEGPISWDSFAGDFVSDTPPETVFFLDTSFLHRKEIPEAVFEALLSRKVAVTPLVWGELGDWLEKPFANAAFRDVLTDAREQSTTSSVIFPQPGEWSNGIYESVRYYMSLLSLRKYIGPSFREAMTKDGEPPATASLTSRIQRSVGNRGTELARKGLSEYEKPNFLADEELVVAAVTYAIVNGCECCILTRDRDPLEQFRKFMWLLGTHFRSSLIAKSFIETPENVVVLDSPIDIPAGTKDCFEGENRCVLGLPRRFVDWVVPRQCEQVFVRCHRLAGDGSRMKMASLAYGAVRQMEDLLRVKGKTNGRNYELPDGRNCHLTVSPPFLPHMDGKAIVGHDRLTRLGLFHGPIVDIEYALQEVQRFKQRLLNTSMPEPEGGSPGARLADFYLPKRLTFASEPEWQRIEWTELTKAIRHLDAAAMFFVDRAVVESLAVDARRALVARHFTWLPASRNSALGESFEADERRTLEKIHLIDLPKDAPWEYGYGYYLALLSLRRQFARIIRRRVERDEGRECSDREVREIAEHYGGIRGRRLAELGGVIETDPHAFAGDELLAFGSIVGILEGTDVVFLTRDPVFLDQFVKLMKVLCNDYVASQFGRSTGVDEFPRFPAHDVELFGLGQVMMRNLTGRWAEELLPSNPYLLNFHCWLLGQYDAHTVPLAATTFCAERGMHNLLKAKGENDGRNAAGLGGENLRAAISGLSDEAIVTAWRDRMVSIGKPDFPSDDRLDLRVNALPAADISRMHSPDAEFQFPWCESPFSVGWHW
ncbi:MAG: hypothetical protein RIC55_31325 [Pirellulaceae bacterium]